MRSSTSRIPAYSRTHRNGSILSPTSDHAPQLSEALSQDRAVFISPIPAILRRCLAAAARGARFRPGLASAHGRIILVSPRCRRRSAANAGDGAIVACGSGPCWQALELSAPQPPSPPELTVRVGPSGNPNSNWPGRTTLPGLFRFAARPCSAPPAGPKSAVRSQRSADGRAGAVGTRRGDRSFQAMELYFSCLQTLPRGPRKAHQPPPASTPSRPRSPVSSN
jgi:hypothetical protein